jgi:hypothetical protein
MFSMLKSITATVAAVLIAATASAQTKPAAPARIDPAARAAADALVVQLGIRPQLQAQMNSNIAQMKSGAVVRAMLAQQPGFIPAYQANKARFDVALGKAGAIQADVAQKVVTQNLNAVLAEAANAYARTFTVAELNGMLAFYRSPLGQAMQKKQPLVANQIGQATARLIGQKIDSAMQANQGRLREALAPLNSAPTAAK